MKLTPRDRRTILLGVIALAAIVVVRFVGMPWLDHWRAARDQREATLVTMRSLNADLQKHDRETSAQARIYGDGIYHPLEDLEHTRLRFLKTLQALSKNGGVGLQMTPAGVSRSREVPGVVFVNYKVKGGCNPASLAKLLDQMRNSEQLIIVDDLKMTTPDRKKKGKLQVEMTLYTPALREDES